MNESKAWSADIKVADGDLGPNEFVAVMSAPTVDRDNEIIDSGAFDPLPEKITVDIDHAMSVEKVVASGQPFYDRSGRLMIRGMFASTQLAQDTRTLVREGHVDRMSVTFREATREKDPETGVVHIKSAELLNVAFVVIPSNRDAAVLAAKQTASVGEHGAELVTFGSGWDQPIATTNTTAAHVTWHDVKQRRLSDADRLADAVKQLGDQLDRLSAIADALGGKDSTATAPDAGPELPAAEAAASRPPARQRSAAVAIARARLALGD
jgi:HK97 family phage prohead protease